MCILPEGPRTSGGTWGEGSVCSIAPISVPQRGSHGVDREQLPVFLQSRGRLLSVSFHSEGKRERGFFDDLEGWLFPIMHKITGNMSPALRFIRIASNS